MKEGISLLRKTGVKLIERPGGLIPTKRGRVANGPELTERMSTSFSLLESEVNFIYDYLYSKSGNILGGFTKEEFMTALSNFTNPQLSDHSMILEVFTDSKDESEALYLMSHIQSDAKGMVRSKLKDAVRNVAGEKGINAIKKILKK